MRWPLKLLPPPSRTVRPESLTIRTLTLALFSFPSTSAHTTRPPLSNNRNPTQNLTLPTGFGSNYKHQSIQRFSSLGVCLVEEKLKKMANPLPKTEEEWRLKLTPEQFRILRKKGTEMAGTGELNKHKALQGVYECAGCAAPLYRYDHKFDSGCGWPAFFDAFPGAVSRTEERMFGIVRTEITCTNCGGHLGHVFKGEGYGFPTDERHCVNSVSIRFNDKISADEARPRP